MIEKLSFKPKRILMYYTGQRKHSIISCVSTHRWLPYHQLVQLFDCFPIC